jgi:SAM-dependent methyltransferase
MPRRIGAWQAEGLRYVSFMNPAEFANIRKSEESFWWYRGMRAILFRFLDPYLKGRSVTHALEAGCGTGYLSQLLQSERGWPIVPLDYSPDGLRYARELGVRWAVQGDTRDLPFGDGTFDLTLSIDVLAHVPRGEEHLAARELARVTRRGGLLVIRTSALDILHSHHSEFVDERQRFTRRRLMGLVTGAGVRVLRCTYINSLLLPIALIKFRVIEPLSKAPATSGVEPVASWLDRLLYLPLGIESAWVGGGHSLPLGQSLLLIGERM